MALCISWSHPEIPLEGILSSTDSEVTGTQLLLLPSIASKSLWTPPSFHLSSPAPFCALSVCFLGSGVLLSLPSSPPHSFPLVWSLLLPPMKPYQDDRQHKILGNLRRWMNADDLLLSPFILILNSAPGVRQWLGMVALPPDTHMVLWLAMTKCFSPAFLHGVHWCCIQLGLLLKHEARK